MINNWKKLATVGGVLGSAVLGGSGLLLWNKERKEQERKEQEREELERKKLEREELRKQKEKFENEMVFCASCGEQCKRKDTIIVSESVGRLSDIKGIAEYLENYYKKKFGDAPVCHSCCHEIQGEIYQKLAESQYIAAYPPTYKGKIKYKDNSSIWLKTSCYYKDKDLALVELKYLAIDNGKNVITNLEYEYDTEYDGNYQYKTWVCSGVASSLVNGNK
jgi:hypothetical protein